MSALIKRVGRAIDNVEVGFEIRLTRLVDGVSTYTMTYPDGEVLEFDSHSDAVDSHNARLINARARAAIEEIIGAIDEQHEGAEYFLRKALE